MKRDKIISVRVNKELYDKVLEIINQRTKKFTAYYALSERNYYHYTNENGKEHYGKFTVADIIENAFKEFVKT